MRRVQPPCAWLLAASLPVLVACVESVRLEGDWTALDRPASARVWATTERAAAALLDEFPRAMERVEATMSTGREGSELNRLNDVAADDYYRLTDHDLFRAVVLAVDYAKASRGTYDPTLGPLLRLYERARPDLPEEAVRIGLG